MPQKGYSRCAGKVPLELLQPSKALCESSPQAAHDRLTFHLTASPGPSSSSRLGASAWRQDVALVPLLASLTQSMVQRLTPQPPASGAGAGTGVLGGALGSALGAPRSVLLPQISIQQLPAPPGWFQEQELCEALLAYHTTKHGGFPRSCPHCRSSEFIVHDPQTGVADFESRPCRCEMCQSWCHYGCVGVQYVEQVPPRPWFHCNRCRDTYLQLEALAERNPLPSKVSPHYKWYLLTDIDHQRHAAGLRHRGPVDQLQRALTQGLTDSTVEGYGQLGREYDGGKYGMLLMHKGEPVAAATFNVYGPVAQLCMLSTLPRHRLQGHARALTTELEAFFGNALRVEEVIVQPRKAALVWWTSKLGYEVASPEEVAKLHEEVPVAYYDARVLRKALPPHGAASAGGGAGASPGVGAGPAS